MTIDEVVKLIEACKHGGIQRLKWEKLELNFHLPPPPAPMVPLINRDVREIIDEEIQSDMDLNDIEKQNLMIDNPLAFEDYLRREEYGKERLDRRSKRNVFTE